MKVVRGTFFFALLIYNLVMVNLIAREFFIRYDLTSDKKYDLSPQTRNFLGNLKNEIKIYTTPPLGGTPDASLPNAWQKVRELLTEFQGYTGKLVVRELNPLKSDFISLEGELRGFFSFPTANTIYIFTGKEKDKQTRSVAVKDLYVGKPDTGAILEFIGEQRIMNAINAIVSKEKLKIYFTIGHGELLVTNDQTYYSFSGAKDLIEESENATIAPIDLTQVREIPRDCDALLILGAATDLKAEELEPLRHYLKGGGRIFMSLHPNMRLDLNLYRLVEGCGIIIDRRKITSGRMGSVMAGIFSNHKINDGMQGKSITFSEPLIVRKRPEFANDPDIQELFYCQAGNFLIDPSKVDAEQLRNPQPIAAAVKLGSTRIVVWGSSYPITNMEIVKDPLIVDYFANTIRWLCSKEDRIFAPAKIFKRSPLKLTEQDMSFLLIICLGVIPGSGVLLGIIVWFLRRK